jgi:hypothetical protein
MFALRVNFDEYTDFVPTSVLEDCIFEFSEEVKRTNGKLILPEVGTEYVVTIAKPEGKPLSFVLTFDPHPSTQDSNDLVDWVRGFCRQFDKHPIFPCVDRIDLLSHEKLRIRMRRLVTLFPSRSGPIDIDWVKIWEQRDAEDD